MGQVSLGPVAGRHPAADAAPIPESPPEIDHVYLYLDNDRASLDDMAKIRAVIYADKTLDTRVKVITAEPPPKEYGKHYNQMLQKRPAERKAQPKRERSIAR